jgi:hypothetical protein
MPLIFSPLSEDILEGPFKPLPRTAFVMLHSGRKVSPIEEEMDRIVCDCFKRLGHPVIKAARFVGTKDFLEKIIQIIRGCGFGVAIFSESTPAPTLANIFFEIGLCNILGKPVILVKTAKAKAPSDFTRTEWVTFRGRDERRLKDDLESSIESIIELAQYYEALGDLAMEADNIDVELAFERYKQAVLISDSKSAQEKIQSLLQHIKNKGESAELLRASKARLGKSISEFLKLLP